MLCAYTIVKSSNQSMVIMGKKTTYEKVYILSRKPGCF